MNKAREAWVGKQSVPLRTYEAYCQDCGIHFQFEACIPTEEHLCPFCESEDPMSVKEAK